MSTVFNGTNITIRNNSVAATGKSNVTIKVRKEDGRITVTDPVTIKNQIAQVPNIADIGDVNVVNLVDGAILRYNANTETYDIGPANNLSVSTLSANSLTLVNPLQSIYGGTGFSLYTAGDLLYAANSTHLMKLPIGAHDTVLTVNNGVLAYSNVIDGGFYGL
jgi:hypothetical protein